MMFIEFSKKQIFPPIGFFYNKKNEKKVGLASLSLLIKMKLIQ
jgi:hypothetical protein